MKLTREQFRRLTRQRRFRPTMTRALRLVLVDGRTQADAARMAQVSRQAVNKALVSVAAFLPPSI